MPSYYLDPAPPEANVPRKAGVTALIARSDTIVVERRIDNPDVRAFDGGTLDPDGTVCRVLSIAFRVTVAGDAEPLPSGESAGMEFVAVDELAALPFWAIQRPVRDAFLANSATPVVA